MHETRHAAVRTQQRALPPFVDFLLNEFGEEMHDGNGAIRVYFSHKSIRRMEQAFGHQPVGLFRRYLNAYKIESTRDGCVITRGWRTKRIRRS
jgi:hypothetical protein